MELEESIQDNKLGLKQRSVDIYNKFKFPITLEPIVFFFTLSVGLNEVCWTLNVLTSFLIEHPSRLSDLT